MYFKKQQYWLIIVMTEEIEILTIDLKESEI